MQKNQQLRMISQNYIESAKIIRKEFLELSSKLNLYEGDVRNLANFLLEKVDELSKYNKEVVLKIKSKEEIKIVTNHILAKIQEIEDEEKKLAKKVEKINLRLEKLKQDEKSLYDSIKKKYPKLTDQEIINQIHPHLDK